MTHSPTTLGTTFEEREAWLRNEVVSYEAERIIKLIKAGDAGWIADPYIDGVYAVKYMGPEPMPNDKIILVIYENGRDWEFSDEGEDLLRKMQGQEELSRDEEDV